MQWRKITLVGVGMLGGSLGLALKRRRLTGNVYGYVRRQSALAESLDRGAVDHVGLDLPEAVQDADLIVLCTPIAQMASLVRNMRPALKRGALVTDVGSVKASVVREVEPLLAGAGAFFVGSHPMAGSERMGITEAQADLFVDAICVVTPTPQVPLEQVERLEQFWRSVGGIAMRLAPEQHDELVCRASHLPHVLASVLAQYVLRPEWPKEQARICANGFRDTTRIASGSPEMWRDICLANHQHLDLVLEAFIENLQEFRTILNAKEAQEMEQFFVRAKQRRDQWQSRRDSGFSA